MKKYILAATLGLLVGVAPVAVQADSWMAPQPRLFISEVGSTQYGLKVLPQKQQLGKPATGVLFSMDEQGRFKTIWKRTLVNIPLKALISPTGNLVTIDTYARAGFQHAVVVYDKTGKLRADYPLEKVLSKADLAKVPQSVSSRWWTGERQFTFMRDEKDREALLITDKEGGEIKVALPSGTITRSPAPRS